MRSFYIDLVKIKGSAWKVLPTGVHVATFDEVANRYGGTSKRQRLIHGFRNGANNLFSCGCPRIYLDGSFVTDKINPNDFDCCWDEQGVNVSFLDPTLVDFSNERQAQKNKYYGEFFPSCLFAIDKGYSFLELFQKDKDTGEAKGIIQLNNWIT